MGSGIPLCQVDSTGLCLDNTRPAHEKQSLVSHSGQLVSGDANGFFVLRRFCCRGVVGSGDSNLDLTRLEPVTSPSTTIQRNQSQTEGFQSSFAVEPSGHIITTLAAGDSPKSFVGVPSKRGESGGWWHGIQRWSTRTRLNRA